MSFIQPCFIRKNTPEIRQRLDELGYLPPSKVWYNENFAICVFWRDNNGEYLIYEIDDDFERIIAPNYPFIDCGENEELFIALASLRDDSDNNQWFVNDCGYFEMCFNDKVENYLSGEGIRKYRQIDETYHKATVEEIIRHFSK